MCDIPAPATAIARDRWKYNVTTDRQITYRDLEASRADLESRLRDDMELVIMLGIEAHNAKYYAPDSPLFGDEVASAFPCVAYEIAEAAKCLALDRSTASAFHSIRCLEAGIRAMARCLAIADPVKGADRSWMKLLGAIKVEIDKRWAPNLIQTGGDAELFANAYAALAGMQNPWRNATMHLDQIYTSKDAQHIFEIVGGFMRKLASRMDENGLPLA